MIIVSTPFDDGWSIKNPESKLTEKSQIREKKQGWTYFESAYLGPFKGYLKMCKKSKTYDTKDPKVVAMIKNSWKIARLDSCSLGRLGVAFQECCSPGFLMTCSTGSSEAEGMVPNHVHSLMD